MMETMTTDQKKITNSNIKIIAQRTGACIEERKNETLMEPYTQKFKNHKGIKLITKY